MKQRLFIPLIALIIFAFSAQAQARESFLDIEELKTEKGITAWLV